MDGQKYIIFLLTLFGGYCDASTFVLSGVFSSHITGNSVLAMVYLVDGNWIMLTYCAVSLSGFLSGTALGCLLQIYLGIDRKYLLIMLLLFTHTVLIITGFFLLIAGNCTWFIVFLALSMGLQNGVIMCLRNIKIHSTYISGMSTTLLNSLFRNPHSKEQVLRRILFIEIFCFITGALLGGILTYHFSVRGIFFSLLLLLFSGIINYKIHCTNHT